MIRREHDHGGVEQAARFEELHQDAHLVVDLLDQAHIGRDDFFARLVARHVAGIAHVHIGGEHRMRVGAFLLRADCGLDVRRAVHAGVGLRRDVGPVRLDVGQMQAPWPPVVLGFRNELHRAPRHVGRLGMLVRHPRGLVGVHQKPAVLQAPVLGRTGIGPVLPRVRRIVAVLAQIIVVGRPRPPGRMQSIVALVRLEPAFRHMHADDRVWRECRDSSDPPGPAPYGSCRPARCGRRSSSGDRRASVPRPEAASRSSASRASACSGRCRTTSATGRRSAIAHRRWKTARPVWPSRRCSASSEPDARCSRDSRSEAGRT